MKSMQPMIQSLAGLLLASVLGVAGAQTCEEAWAEYNQFKERNKMEESQYPLTAQGAAVRAACGAEALPVPPGADKPPRVIVRKPRKPLPPPPPYPPSPYTLPPMTPPPTLPPVDAPPKQPSR